MQDIKWNNYIENTRINFQNIPVDIISNYYTIRKKLLFF
jgi:hypothetical protein